MNFLQTPLSLAHFYWNQLLKPGAFMVDATCGQGKDALFLAQKGLEENEGKLHLFDIQKKALEITKKRIEDSLPSKLWPQIHYHEQCHSQLDFLKPFQSDLIVYNLGYLPGGEHQLTTLLKTSLESFEKALEILKEGGFLSITCYPGHPEGFLEAEGVLAWAEHLDRSFTVCHHRWLNRSNQAPHLLLIRKN